MTGLSGRKRPALKRGTGGLSTVVAIAVILMAGAAAAEFASAAGDLAQHAHDAASGAGASGAGALGGWGDALLYAARVAYYFALLLATGLPLLSLALPVSERYGALRRLMVRWSGPVLKSLLPAVLVYVFLHSIRTANGLGGGDAWVRLFTETAGGQAWLALAVLSALGLAVVRLPDPFKAAWALALLAAESFNGHAAAADERTAAVVIDFIHLACSAVWAGGVMILLLLWRFERKEAGRFAERFAAVAWATIAILVASGIAMVLLLAPSWHYVLYTDWGRWLLAKSGLVILVVAVGSVLRRKARALEMPRGALLKLDGCLMAGIVAIAAVFTFVSPAPAGEPLRYHHMGNELHYTLELAPNAPGPNTAALTVWLPEETGRPQALSLQFLSEDRPGRPAIAAALSEEEAKAGAIDFPGFVAYYFRSEKITLPHPGQWTAELAITDGTGKTTVHAVPFGNN